MRVKKSSTQRQSRVSLGHSVHDNDRGKMVPPLTSYLTSPVQCTDSAYHSLRRSELRPNTLAPMRDRRETGVSVIRVPTIYPRRCSLRNPDKKVGVHRHSTWESVGLSLRSSEGTRTLTAKTEEPTRSGTGMDVQKWESVYGRAGKRFLCK